MFGAIIFQRNFQIHFQNTMLTKAKAKSTMRAVGHALLSNKF